MQGADGGSYQGESRMQPTALPLRGRQDTLGQGPSALGSLVTVKLGPRANWALHLPVPFAKREPSQISEMK